MAGSPEYGAGLKPPAPDVQEFLRKVEQRERVARRRSIIYSLVPIVIAVVLLTVTGRQVYEAETRASIAEGRVKTAQQKQKDLDAEIKLRTDAIAALNQQQPRGVNQQTQKVAPPVSGPVMTQRAAQVTPITETVKVRASANELPNKAANGDQLYSFALWVDAPPQTLDHIASVQYEFNNPTFRQRIVESKDRSTNFRVSYTGWGCLGSVIVTFKATDASAAAPSQVDFNMCAALGW